jgi:hypothetical protein
MSSDILLAASDEIFRTSTVDNSLITNDYVFLSSTVEHITNLIHIIGRQTFPQLNKALKHCDDVIHSLKQSENESPNGVSDLRSKSTTLCGDLRSSSTILSRSVSDVENSFSELTTSLCNLTTSVNDLKTMIQTQIVFPSEGYLINSFTISSDSEQSPTIKPTTHKRKIDEVSEREDLNELLSTLEFKNQIHEEESISDSLCSDSSLNSDYDPGPSDIEWMEERQVVFIEGNLNENSKLLVSQMLTEYFDQDTTQNGEIRSIVDSIKVIDSQNGDEMIDTEDSESFLIINADD